ncbi:MAG TPA: dienelactone hydrolase family protein [Micromonosporaceae bacterium]|nr:dienelactone hydrolase family protein [Micromonosporaceae bacterium]
MHSIALFHSVYGLRPAVLAAADRLRAAGHRVVTPDLYAGQVADTVDDGFALLDRIGVDLVFERARAAARELPGDTVLAGFSMGAGISGGLLAERPDAAALLLLHGIAGDPAALRAGLPVQLHIADPDEYDPPEEVAGWRDRMTDGGARVEVFGYPGVGHLYTDPDVSDHSGPASELTWQRVLDFLDRHQPPSGG